jgi:predicted DNA-binding protein
MLASVRRTTVTLPNDLDARLRDEAARRGSTIAEVAREAIEVHLRSVTTARQIEDIIRQEAGR